MEFIETEIYLYSPENGGRSNRILGRTDQSFYMPHIVIGDPNQREAITIEKDGSKNVSAENYLGVRFESTEEFEYLPTERRIRVVMKLIYQQKMDYERAVGGATFTIREGARIIGYGTIFKRWKDKTREPVGSHNSGGSAPSA